MFLITISPWQLRNLSTFGHYSLTSIGGYSLCNYNVNIVKAHLENKSTSEVKKDFMEKVKDVKNPFEKSKILEKTALEYILNHPMEYLQFHIRGILNMFLATSKADLMDLYGIKYQEVKKEPLSEGIFDRIYRNINSPNEYYLTPILALKNLLEYSFFIVGLFMMFIADKDKKIYWIFLLLIILYFVNITSVIGSPRYKIPIIPFYHVISAKGVCEIFKLRMGKNWIEK